MVEDFSLTTQQKALSRRKGSGLRHHLVHSTIPEECSCYSNEPLLYALSAVAVLLFLCVLIFSGVYCSVRIHNISSSTIILSTGSPRAVS
ncbi:hypothetical protein SRHO_G00335620 [Serrasalmus rhombeus]